MRSRNPRAGNNSSVSYPQCFSSFRFGAPSIAIDCFDRGIWIIVTRAAWRVGRDIELIFKVSKQSFELRHGTNEKLGKPGCRHKELPISRIDHDFLSWKTLIIDDKIMIRRFGGPHDQITLFIESQS